MSRLAWGVWVEIYSNLKNFQTETVTPRMRRVSWNFFAVLIWLNPLVTPRMRRVSWNPKFRPVIIICICHASHEACELKFPPTNTHFKAITSRLAWGVWVEIWEIFIIHLWRVSRLAWGVWVEIISYVIVKIMLKVTPRMRRVSWNL